MADDFYQAIKDKLAKRAGQACSRCEAPTSGPHGDEERAVNVGVAAHIRAASPGGPRYDEDQTAEERSGISNGIWLCQTCSVLVDRDVVTFTVARLSQIKEDAEERARVKLGQAPQRSSEKPDVLGIFLKEVEHVEERARDLNRRAGSRDYRQVMSVGFERVTDETWTRVLNDALPEIQRNEALYTQLGSVRHWIPIADRLLPQLPGNPGIIPDLQQALSQTAIALGVLLGIAKRQR